MKAPEKKVRLRGDGKMREFSAAHAEALLAYPGTKWEVVEEKAAEKPAGETTEVETTKKKTT